uniref:serine hydrolase domain-containing protein n=1 Tax=Microbulbifer agarilyticus TaxID=260552 RepID=UPI000255BA8C|nr:serine hydrolase [Microbulbifer agarilyticus]
MISFLIGSLVTASVGPLVPAADPLPIGDGAAPYALEHPVEYPGENLFEELVEYLGASGEYQEVHSLLVFRGGEVLAERYFAGNADYIDFLGGVKRVAVPNQKQWRASDLHYVASVNKSVTALLTGIWLHEQGRTATQTMAPLLPRYRSYFSDPAKAALTVHDILSMQSGFRWDEWNDDDLVRLWQTDNFADFLLARANHGPGKKWRYNSAAPNLLYEAIQETLSVPLQLWAEQRLYRPLGITEFHWGRQPNGIAEASARLSLLPRDMLNLGVLILQRGRWKGQQVVPPRWIQQMCSVQAEGPSGAYGYGIWPRNFNGLSVCTAEGDGGQYIHVIEEKEMVVVMTQGNYLQWPLYRNQSDEILQRLLEALD